MKGDNGKILQIIVNKNFKIKNILSSIQDWEQESILA